MLPHLQLTEILAALPDPAFILTRSGRYAAVFGGADSRYYHDGSGLVGLQIADVLSADKTRWFLAQIDQALASNQLHIVEYGLAGRDVKGLPEEGPTDQIWFEGRVQKLPFPVDGEAAVLWVASNISARHELELQLRALSETDPLTGLCNRRKLFQELQRRLDELRRYATPTSVLAFDLDHLKALNDRYGHALGDQALRGIAECCRQELRATDLVARLGGDEFVVLLPNTPLELALPLAERLRQRVPQLATELGISQVATTLSGGISALRADDASVEEVLKRADAALYRAKQGGRDRVVGGEY